MFSLINCQIRAEPMRQNYYYFIFFLKGKRTHTHTSHVRQCEDWGKSERLGGLLGRFHHRGRPPSAAGGGGDRLFFTVRDLIARRFHYLCTNVTFSSDQGARQPPAARLASCQAIVQPIEVGEWRAGGVQRRGGSPGRGCC